MARLLITTVGTSLLTNRDDRPWAGWPCPIPLLNRATRSWMSMNSRAYIDHDNPSAVDSRMGVRNTEGGARVLLVKLHGAKGKCRPPCAV